MVEGESTADDEEGRNPDAEPEVVVEVWRRQAAGWRRRLVVGVVDDGTDAAAALLVSAAASVSVQSVSAGVVRLPQTVAAWQLLRRGGAVPRRRRVPGRLRACAAAGARRLRVDHGVRRCRQLLRGHSWVLSLEPSDKYATYLRNRLASPRPQFSDIQSDNDCVIEY